LTWTRLTDTWCDDKMLRPLNLAARWHYLAMILACSRNEDFDGVMRLRDAERASDVDDPIQALADLIDAKLVVNVDGATVKVKRIEEHVPPKSVREKSADRTRRWRKHKDGDHSECTAKNCDASRDGHRDTSPRDGDGDRTGRDGKNLGGSHLSEEERAMLDEYEAEQGYRPDDPDLFAGKEAS
jgi:hypothetical protein